MDCGSVVAEIWLREADAGRITVEYVLTGDYSAMVDDYLLWCVRSGVSKPLAFFINCIGSDHRCWRIYRSMIRLSERAPSLALISSACSGGLIVALGATVRQSCGLEAQFSWHASTSKPGFDESHMSDEQRIDHICSRTTASREFWTEKAASGEPFKFGPEEALELGVIHGTCPPEAWEQ